MAVFEGTFDRRATLSAGHRRGVVTLHDEFVKMYEAHRREVFRYLLTMRIAPAMAQDITQDAFLRLYVALRNGERIDKSRAWVFTVAHNMALDHFRQRSQQTTAPLSPSPQTPEQEMIQAERTKRMNDALRDLSPQQLNCLNLRAEGFRYREIAEIVGISTSAVGEFLRRGIVRLRRAIYG